MKKYALIVAGGAGLRMGAALPKQFLLLNGKPVLLYTIDTFLQSFPDLTVIIVLSEEYFESGKSIIQGSLDGSRILFTKGGSTRFHSVQNGLKLVDQPSVVFVHDGVRCLVSSSLIQKCYANAIERGNCIPAISAVDSVRIEAKDGSYALNRNLVKLIQTPQTFLSDIIIPAFQREYEDSFTDEASVVELSGTKLHLVEGEATNIKITKPLDLLIASEILKACTQDSEKP